MTVKTLWFLVVQFQKYELQFSWQTNSSFCKCLDFVCACDILSSSTINFNGPLEQLYSYEALFLFLGSLRRFSRAELSFDLLEQSGFHGTGQG